MNLLTLRFSLILVTQRVFELCETRKKYTGKVGETVGVEVHLHPCSLNMTTDHLRPVQY